MTLNAIDGALCFYAWSPALIRIIEKRPSYPNTADAAALRTARRVLVVGARGAAPLALHLWSALDELGLDARDAVVAIGFSR